MEKLARVRKLVVAVVGLGAILIQHRYGIDVSSQMSVWVDLALAALTAAGVYQVPNAA